MQPVGSEYVAMGSSFAAGPGIQPKVEAAPRGSGRSQNNYANLLAAKLGLSLTDVTFSGTTSADFLETQVAAVTAETKLVTVTGGGNDVGYVPALLLPSLPAVFAVLGVRGRVSKIRDELDASFATLETNFSALVEAIHVKAPGCRVAFVEYLTVLPPAGVDTGRLSAEDAEFARGISARLSKATARVPGAEFVAAGAASVDHHAWAADPWTMQFRFRIRGGAAYHPNAAGMAAVAELAAAQLHEGFA